MDATSRELGPLDDRGRAIGEDGARRLASAGRRAFARGDVPAAATLLGRAAALLPADHPERLRLLPEHGEALLMTGRFDEASAVLEEAIGHARERARRRGARDARPAARSSANGRGRVGSATRSTRRSPQRSTSSSRQATRQGWRWRGAYSPGRPGTACRFGDAAEASRSEPSSMRGGRATSARSGAPRRRTPAAASLGPTHVDEAIDRCEAASRADRGRPSVRRATSSPCSAGLYAMQGAFDHARALVARARAMLEELGLEMDVARVGHGGVARRDARGRPRGGRARAA